ncbi:phosphate/phosphite/phosphonate ABC transporter substrate-binding protein [Flavisphingomonas formosensis]|uniref:phosphate/phosphite/phosphonate ABC transporter substrate-binding protein n=1 Tax=Flavisphingomonas formosensis TaxID=861534 RepID=UPI0012FCACDA|nr:PhnD/SsuA/transferrin family substrate-binding protein [Sphingomonas formosensis]
MNAAPARIANARMYAVAPGAAAAWRRFFGWLTDASGISLEIIDHAYPAPLPALWARPDLACGFMCGLPFARSAGAVTPIAAPIPASGPTAGRAAYATHFVVAAGAPYRMIEDTFGRRIGTTVETSHSGYNAVRHHLLPYRRQRGGAALYTETVGGLHTPRRVIEAVIAGMIDVGPLDSFAYELIRLHEPGLASAIRILATTQAAPIPLLVAHAACPDAVVLALREALLSGGGGVERHADALALQGFAPIDPQSYRCLAEREDEAVAAGYGMIV